MQVHYLKIMILLEEISWSQAETESVVFAVGTNTELPQSPLDNLEEKIVAWKNEKSPDGAPEQSVEVDDDDVCDTVAVANAGIEGEDIDVLGQF